MSSSVFYRFKSQKEPSRVTFDGTGISVFELKREIIAQSRLGDGTDFELLINSEDSTDGYDDDTLIIPRSTTVIAKRLPASKPGRGGAARYVSGKMPQNAKSSYKQDSMTKSASSRTSNGIAAMHGAQNEEERIAAMLQMGADDWAQQQQHMASAAPVHRSGPMKGKPNGMPDRPLPQGYVCNRCGEKGHWIWDCPTNNDPTFDGRPRIKRTTGIPKSFLKTIEKPPSLVNDGTSDDKKQPTGVMVNSEGEWVVAEPDQAAWDKYQAQAKSSVAAQTAAAHGNKELQDRGLECRIDKRLFVNPTKTPCCGTTYCHECIQNTLLDNDLRCPQCSTDNVPVDDLIPDEVMALKVRSYEQEKAKVSKESTKRQSDSPKPDKDQTSAGRTATLSPSKALGGRPLVSGGADSARRSPGKRSAESELVNDHRPQSPKPTLAKAENSTPQDRSPKGKPSQPTMPAVNNIMDPSLFNPMSMNNMNSFMGMGMPFSSMAMPNPIMMPTGSFMGAGWNNNMWGMPYPQQNVPMAQTGFNSGHNFNGQARANGMGVNADMAANSRFANQQRSNNEEESAYFRKPVNPNRQHNRRNYQNRPADYREV